MKTWAPFGLGEVEVLWDTQLRELALELCAKVWPGHGCLAVMVNAEYRREAQGEAGAGPAWGLLGHRPSSVIRNVMDNWSIEFLRIRNSWVTAPRGWHPHLPSSQRHVGVGVGMICAFWCGKPESEYSASVNAYLVFSVFAAGTEVRCIGRWCMRSLYCI